MLTSTEECVKEKLVEFIHNPRDRVKESCRFSAEAAYSLKSARDFLRTGHFKYSIIAAYDSMEASAKAQLALKGIKPKMHKCVFLYLEKEFVRGKLLDKKYLDILVTAHTARVQAHYVIGRKVSRGRAEGVLEKAEHFVGEMKNLTEKLK